MKLSVKAATKLKLLVRQRFLNRNKIVISPKIAKVAKKRTNINNKKVLDSRSLI